MLGKVGELIDPHTAQWDEAPVRSVFSPVNVHRILQIPLRVEVMDDVVAWHNTRSGTFSVRSTYYVKFEHQFGHNWNHNNGPGSHQECDSWKKFLEP